jgi:hypothetical protein
VEKSREEFLNPRAVRVTLEATRIDSRTVASKESLSCPMRRNKSKGPPPTRINTAQLFFVFSETRVKASRTPRIVTGSKRLNAESRATFCNAKGRQTNAVSVRRRIVFSRVERRRRRVII